VLRGLVATVEADARGAEGSSDTMPIELFCEESNDRGLAFWRSLGLREVGTADGAPHSRRFIR